MVVVNNCPSERVLQAQAATEPDTQLPLVRFGNVLGSSGSVVPKFSQLLPGAAPSPSSTPRSSVLHDPLRRGATDHPRLNLAQGGDVICACVGKSVKVIDLVRSMDKLSNLSLRDPQDIERDIEIQITGLRPGEKLCQELLIGDNPSIAPTSGSSEPRTTLCLGSASITN